VTEEASTTVRFPPIFLYYISELKDLNRVIDQLIDDSLVFSAIPVFLLVFHEIHLARELNQALYLSFAFLYRKKQQ
jgi:hypothetical protein